MKGLRRRTLALVLALVMVLGLLPGTPIAKAEGGLDMTVSTPVELGQALQKIRMEGEDGQENIIRLGADIDLSDYEYDLIIENNTTLLGQGHTLNMGKISFTIIRGATLSLGKENPQGNENSLTITSSATKDDPRVLSAIFVGGYDPDVEEPTLLPGDLKMYDGVEITGMVSNNKNGASAINISSGEFDMYGGKIHHNQSYPGTPGKVGAAIFIMGSKKDGVTVTFNMKGGEISDNYAKMGDEVPFHGSAIFSNRGNFKMTAGKIINNRMEGHAPDSEERLYGGAISAVNSTINLRGDNRDAVLISGNKGAASGGAISLVNSPLTAENATIEGNSSSLYGGALTTNGKVTLKNVLVRNNTSKQGGGIFLDEGGDLTCEENTLFQGNTAKEAGGAIYDKKAAAMPDSSAEEYEDLTVDKDNYFQNIHLDETTGFDQNQAEGGLFVPPSNWSAFTNLGYKQDPTLHNPTGIPSPLNNYDINYKNDFFFIGYDGNGAKGSMPVSAYKNGKTVTVKLPENGFEVPAGKAFNGWMIEGEKKAVGDEIKVNKNTMVQAQWKTVYQPGPDPESGTTSPETGKILKERIAGEDRIKTAIALSKKNFDHADYVVLARYDNYADALTAGVLAKALNAPILLTKTRSLDGGVKAEISRLGVKEVILVGGDSALNNEVEGAVKKGWKSNRIGGSNRYETSALIARKIAELKGNPEKVILTTGLNYADALSISPYSGKMAYPILLTKTNALPDVIEKTIQDLKVSSALVMGGKAALTDSVVKDLPQKMDRIGGETRYETSAIIAERFFPKATVAYLVSGEDFADALAAGPVAAGADVPVILTKKADLPKVIAKHIQKASYEKIIIVGGVNAVSKAVEDALK